VHAREMAPALFVALSAAGLLAQGRGDLPQFRTVVELIQLDVTVLDGKRQPVRGLTADDFTVLDNGKPATVRAFTPVELASTPAAGEPVWATRVRPDVATNQIGREEGRLVVILMDRSIPPGEPTTTARRIATAAVGALGPADLAAVVSTSNGAVQPLTADHARLLGAINAGDPSTGMSSEALTIMDWLVPLNPLSDGRCLCGLCVLETITRVADAVRDAPRRRKVLFFIGSSVVWQSAAPAGGDVGCGSRLRDARATTFTAVDRANLTVHAIDPLGLSSVGPQTKASTKQAPPGAPRDFFIQKQQQEMNGVLSAQGSVAVLPDRTGGRTVLNRNSPDAVVPDIVRESEAYYLVGIERSAAGPSGADHTIEVKVRRKGTRVYAQRSYAALPVGEVTGGQDGATPAGSPDQALARLLPDASKPLAMAVTAFANTGTGKAVVRVDVDAGAFARPDGGAVPLGVALLATDRTGREVASARQTSTISGTRPVGSGPVEVNLQSHVELGEGDYGVRVAVSDTMTGAVASVFSEVTIPDFARAPLSLSDIIVEAGAPPPATTMPTTRRTFGKADHVRAVMQIYQGTHRTEALRPVTLRVRILDATGTAVRDESVPYGADTFAERRKNCAITLPLADVARGEYFLQLDATAGSDTAGRALRFAVR
jgi:VWFA-related protein